MLALTTKVLFGTPINPLPGSKYNVIHIIICMRGVCWNVSISTVRVMNGEWNISGRKCHIMLGHAKSRTGHHNGICITTFKKSVSLFGGLWNFLARLPFA